jgi:CelD/BcsL family acetyltransferase involved in cellulose biosynthesis
MSKPAVIDPRHEGHVSREPGARGGMPPQSPIEIGIYHQLDVIEPEWRRFEQGADCSAFQAFDWLAAWCRYVGPLEGAQPVIVVGCKADGTTLFILPLAVTSGVVRRLTWLGSDLCDYNGPLLAKEFSSQVPPEDFRALWQDIGRRLMSDPLTRYDLVSFSKLPERVGAQANPFLALSTDLPATWSCRSR